MDTPLRKAVLFVSLFTRASLADPILSFKRKHHLPRNTLVYVNSHGLYKWSLMKRLSKMFSLYTYREDGKYRMQFFQHFVEDRTESSMSYYEFLQHIQKQVKSWELLRDFRMKYHWTKGWIIKFWTVWYRCTYLVKKYIFIIFHVHSFWDTETVSPVYLWNIENEQK